MVLLPARDRLVPADEATSALDAESGRLLWDNIARTDRLMKRLGFNLIGGNYSLWVERGAEAERA